MNNVTDSLIVAKIFHKRHKNVLRDIENLECSDEFNGLNFEPVNYTDAKGEKRPAYKITRDGFALPTSETHKYLDTKVVRSRLENKTIRCAVFERQKENVVLN